MGQVVTTRIDDETLASLDRLASHHDRSRAWLVAEAVRRYVAVEGEFLDFIEEGAQDFARGDYVTHEEFVAGLRAHRHKSAA